ncbi:helix-turn-helix transcriptional regulator [Microbacteriaceae bacterium VKM Ac-2854]|nr:helix-turn-helix transcriptional regulator [Microbacteriaceae bacterium VKM Ac-2854]
MARQKTFDDVAVAAAARDLFWQHGYAATSLAQLQEATGLSKSSLYESYGSKRGLFDRAIRSYLDEIIEPLLGPVESGEAGLGVYFGSLARVFREAPPQIARRGCLLLNTAMELDDLDAEAARTVAAYRERVRAAFATADAADPELLTAAQIGLMVTSRLDPAAAASLADALAASARS